MPTRSLALLPVAIVTMLVAPASYADDAATTLVGCSRPSDEVRSARLDVSRQTIAAIDLFPSRWGERGPTVDDAAWEKMRSAFRGVAESAEAVAPCLTGDDAADLRTLIDICRLMAAESRSVWVAKAKANGGSVKDRVGPTMVALAIFKAIAEQYVEGQMPTGHSTVLPVANADPALSDGAVKKLLIEESVNAYDGNCPCPYHEMSNGRSCGGASAYNREGGEAPLCYARDVTQEMVQQYRDGLVVRARSSAGGPAARSPAVGAPAARSTASYTSAVVPRPTSADNAQNGVNPTVLFAISVGSIVLVIAVGGAVWAALGTPGLPRIGGPPSSDWGNVQIP